LGGGGANRICNPPLYSFLLLLLLLLIFNAIFDWFRALMILSSYECLQFDFNSIIFGFFFIDVL